MPPTRSIKGFFNRPHFPLVIQETPPDNNSSSSRKGRPSPIPSDPPATSPLTEPPSSSPLAKNVSGLFSDTSPPSSRIEELQFTPVKKEKPKVESLQQPQFLDTDSAVTKVPPGETSFTSSSSHRMVKDGKEVVTGSDGEDTDSVTSLEAPEDFFAKLAGPESTDGAADVKETKQEKKGGRSRRENNISKTSKFSSANYAAPTYKNTLDALVTEAVDDNETEAGIAELKATLKRTEKDDTAATSTDVQGKHLHEGMLTSALGDKSDELEFQRLLDAVRRTEAFEQDKIWSFFSKETAQPPGSEFPRSSVAPASYMAVLRGSCSVSVHRCLLVLLTLVGLQNPNRVSEPFIQGLLALLCPRITCQTRLSSGFLMQVR